MKSWDTYCKSMRKVYEIVRMKQIVIVTFRYLPFLIKHIEIIETSFPSINYDNHPSSLMSKSYGYGIQISPLHLTKATAIALNGGKLVLPTLLKYRPNPKKIVSSRKAQSSGQTRLNHARVPGYD